MAGLCASHLLNLYFQWALIRRDLAQKPVFQSPEYTFLDFAPFHRREIEAARRLPNAAPAGRIFSYFDLIHPAVFMVWNNGSDGDFFDLGPVLAAFPTGASRVTFSPGSVFLMRHEKEMVARNFGGSILGSGWARFLNAKNVALKKGGGRLSGSFIEKPAHGSLSIRIPYLAYFYIPLAVIIVMIIISGAAMAAAFFYYAVMFFLFDFQKLFVTVPLAWLFNALGIDLPDLWVNVLAVTVALLFLAASVFGLWRWKERDMPSNSKWIVCFFILLPFFLFF